MSWMKKLSWKKCCRICRWNS